MRRGVLARGLVCLGLLLVASLPLLVGISQQRLDESVRAFKDGDFARARQLAMSASSVLPQRAEPYEVLAYSDARLGLGRRAVNAMSAAIRRDPGDWELRYGLALVRGAARLDPRPAARQAARLNPREQRVRRALERFDGEDPRLWRREALRSDLPPYFLSGR